MSYGNSPRRRTRAWCRAFARPRERVRALSDSNIIYAPAFTGDAAVTSHPPAQYNLVDASLRETHHAVDKSARVAGPCLPIATATVDRAIVTAENKRANSKDVLKGQPVIIADLQHAAIEPILQVKVGAEGYAHRASIADRCNVWRNKLLVADRGGIVDKYSIGQRIGRWRRHSGVRRNPRRA